MENLNTLCKDTKSVKLECQTDDTKSVKLECQTDETILKGYIGNSVVAEPNIFELHVDDLKESNTIKLEYEPNDVHTCIMDVTVKPEPVSSDLDLSMPVDTSKCKAYHTDLNEFDGKSIKLEPKLDDEDADTLEKKLFNNNSNELEEDLRNTLLHSEFEVEDVKFHLRQPDGENESLNVADVKPSSISDADSKIKSTEELKMVLNDILLEPKTDERDIYRDGSTPLVKFDSIKTERPIKTLMVAKTPHGTRAYPRIGPSSDLGIYRCNDCTYETPKKQAIKMHLRRHAKIRPFQCTLCPKGYYAQKIFHYHLLYKHKSDIPNLKEQLSYLFESCKYCDFSTPEPWKLKQHLSKHAQFTGESEKLECKQCNYIAFNKKNYDRHMYNVHTNREYRCQHCEKVYREQPSLANHMLNYHRNVTANCQKICGLSVYNCENCEYRSVMKKTLRVHIAHNHKNIAAEDSIKKYTCFKCSFSTSYKNNLKNHMQTHLDVKDFRCSFCSKTHNRQQTLDSHILTQHADQIENLDEYFGNKIKYCSECDFKSVYPLTDHMLTHTDEKKTELFKCEICGFTTKRKHTIKLHTRTHLETKPHKCHSCPNSYSTKSDLGTHILAHHKHEDVGSKQFASLKYKILACKLCSFETISTYRFKFHMYNAHQDESYATTSMKKWVPCPECDFKAVSPSILKRHMVSHEKTRDFMYKCKLCQRKFIKKTGLDSHMKRHQNESRGSVKPEVKYNESTGTSDGIAEVSERYRCYNCKFKTKSKAILAKHMSIHGPLVNKEVKTSD